MEKEKYGYIYLTTNLINGKIYVGQHACNHFDEKYKGSGVILRKAFVKYGWENFKCEILEWCETYKELNDKEEYWIAEKDSTNPEIGYNIALGGNGAPMSEVTKKKLSEISKRLSKIIPNYGGKGRIVSEETRKRISIANTGKPGYWKGKHLSNETKEKIRETSLGQKRPQCSWTPTLEQREAHRQRALARTHSEGYVHPFLGKKHSEETKKKISEKSKIYVKDRIYINNGEIEKRVYENELNSFLNNGWIKGRLPERTKKWSASGSRSAANIIKIHKDTINKNIKKEELEQYLSDGWQLGQYSSKYEISEEKLKEKSKKQAEKIRGRIWMTDGQTDSLICPNEINNYLNLGWKKGRSHSNIPPISEEQKQKLIEKSIEANTGKIRVNNGEINKNISPNELEYYLKNGWKKGAKSTNYNFTPERLKKMSEISKGRINIHKGFEEKRIVPEELEYYLSIGWERGRPKGKFTVSEEVRKQHSEHYKDLIFITKDKVNKRVKKSEVEPYLKEGWALGKYNANSTKGMIMVIKDGKQHRIKKEELSKYEEMGWEKSHIFNKKKVIDNA